MRVLIIDDEAEFRKKTAAVLETMGHKVIQVASGVCALRRMESETFDIALLNLQMRKENGLELLDRLLQKEPLLIVIAFTGSSAFDSAVEAVKKGAYNCVAKPCQPERIRALFEENEPVQHGKERISGNRTSHLRVLSQCDLKSEDPAVRRFHQMALKAAATASSILILGESGTGKSVLARAIHQSSPRKNRAFVTVNCPSLSRELFESELFGHAKGAYTGAVSGTSGKVAVADGGTLFLDEIGELPFGIQSKLLRLLDDKAYERVGEVVSHKANVRLIAASNRELHQAVAERQFREDLYYRLNVITLEMPPLRERIQDLPRIAEKHLCELGKEAGRAIDGFSPEALHLLRQYHWPGNLRELRNAVEHAVVLSENERIEVEDLPGYLHWKRNGKPRVGMLIPLEHVEREHIRRVLRHTNSLEAAARVLDIDPATLYRKRKKLL